MSLPFAGHHKGGPPVFRFAPSPNGPLHRGHALSALLNAELARRHGGRFLLRIEDIDAERSRKEHIAAIEDGLTWLGLDWDRPVRQQSQHMEDYARALDALKRKGVLYPCFCTRGAITAKVADAAARGALWPRDPDGAPLYDGVCRSVPMPEQEARIAAGEAHQWRLDTQKALGLTGPLAWHRFDPHTGQAERVAADPLRWGDPVIARKGLPTSYHLSVVVDDVLQGISHVVRGIDLEPATDIHVVLQSLLGLPQPFYWHHPLVLDAEGRKLAKSKGSRSLQDERAAGVTPQSLRAEALSVLD